MSTRPTKWIASMLVAGVAGTAAFLTGCGSKDEPDPAAGTAGRSDVTAPVDITNPADVERYLAKYGPAPSIEMESPHRGALDGVVFPTWPVGEVRKQGLATYRVDVTPSFDGEASLRFLEGAKTLYEVPFNPERLTTIAPMPAAVADGVKTGSTVKWGVFFADKKRKPITESFTVVDKPAANKQLAMVDADRGLAAQPLLRDVTKARILLNNSLLSEAVVLYAGVATADPSVGVVYPPLVECLRRLKLKNTPLFEDALVRAASNGTVGTQARAGGPTSIGPVGASGPATKGPTFQPGPVPPPSAGTGTARLPGQPTDGAGATPQGTSTGPGDPGALPGGGDLSKLASLKQAMEKIQQELTGAKDAAATAHMNADRLAVDAVAARKAADDAAQTVRTLQGKLATDGATMTEADRLALLAQIQQAQKTADDLRRAAEAKEQEATDAARNATAGDAQFQKLQEQLKLLQNVFGMPGQGTGDGTLTPDQLTNLAAYAKAAGAASDAARQAMEAAQARFDAAKLAYEQAATNNAANAADLAQAMTAAQRDLAAAQKAAQDAQQAFLDAQKLLGVGK